MAERPRPKPNQYHLNTQQADALLGPVRATLCDLEGRLQHYVERLALEATDEEALRAAHRVLAAARLDIDRLWEGSSRGKQSAISHQPSALSAERQVTGQGPRGQPGG